MKIKEIMKSKKSMAAIITLLIGITIAIIKNGGLEGVMIDIPGSDPIELKLPEGCECDECDCKEDACDCSSDICTCPNCLKLT
jgi:hypothetical protein